MRGVAEAAAGRRVVGGCLRERGQLLWAVSLFNGPGLTLLLLPDPLFPPSPSVHLSRPRFVSSSHFGIVQAFFYSIDFPCQATRRCIATTNTKATTTVDTGAFCPCINMLTCAQIHTLERRYGGVVDSITIRIRRRCITKKIVPERDHFIDSQKKCQGRVIKSLNEYVGWHLNTIICLNFFFKPSCSSFEI